MALSMRLEYCCGATWIYALPYSNNYESVKEQIEEAISKRRCSDWPNGQIFILVASAAQVRYEEFVKGLHASGFTCVGAAIGPHENPNYLFMKADKPIPVPDTLKLPEVDK